MRIIADFSKTFTTPGSKSTWSSFYNSGLFPPEYMAERDRLYRENFHYETEENWPEVGRWFGEHLALLSRYGAAARVREVLDLCESAGTLLPRDGLAAFLNECIARGVPVQVVSSGITELVEGFWGKYRLPRHESISIVANPIEPTWMPGISTLAPGNKFEVHTPDTDDAEIVVLGDAHGDFTIPGTTYAPGSKFRGFSFSDAEVYPGVEPLGKDASLLGVLDRLR